MASSVPLKSVEVELEVRDHVATVVSTLSYENEEDKPIEAVFVFPLPGDAAVCHFSAKTGQTEIVAEVKEKQEARDEYDGVLSSGQQAYLLEESEESPDVFSLCVGSLPPGESASIRLEYVTELAVQADDGLRFCLPAVLNPRYQPQASEAGSVQVTSVPASLVPYNLSFSARLSSPRPVSKVESNCPLDRLQYLNTEQTRATDAPPNSHPKPPFSSWSPSRRGLAAGCWIQLWLLHWERPAGRWKRPSLHRSTRKCGPPFWL